MRKPSSFLVAGGADSAIDLYFLNHDQPLLNVTEASTIREAFDMVQPSGSTP